MADRPGITFSIYTSRETYRQLKTIAWQESRSLTSVAREFIEQGLAQRDAGPLDTEASPCSPTC